MSAASTKPTWLARRLVGMAHVFEFGAAMSVCRKVHQQRYPAERDWYPASGARSRCKVCEAMVKAMTLGTGR
jgi:hypothetical protein